MNERESTHVVPRKLQAVTLVPGKDTPTEETGNELGDRHVDRRSNSSL